MMVGFSAGCPMGRGAVGHDKMVGNDIAVRVCGFSAIERGALSHFDPRGGPQYGVRGRIVHRRIPATRADANSKNKQRYQHVESHRCHVLGLFAYLITSCRVGRKICPCRLRLPSMPV